MARQVCEDKSRETASSSAGFFYTDMSSSNPTIQTHHIQAGFVSEVPPADMFNTVMWKSFLGSKPGIQHAAAGPSSSSSKTMNDDSSTNFYHHHQNIEQDFTPGVSVSETTSSENLILHDSSSAPWQDQNKLLGGGDVDDSSLRCVFPCDHVHERRPSQGLSLSLNSTNPSNIGLQSFELRHTTDHHHHHQQQQMLQDGYLMNTKAAANINYQGQIQFLLKNSKFLLPLQDLLNEFCSLGIKQNDLPKQKSQKNKNWEEDNGGMKYSLSSLELVELQKRKTKLLSMLEEVERRYRHYCNQMKAVVSTFEAVAGNGAAIVYSALALKTMSRHFRCLKDGILDQIQATRKAMGEKDPVNVTPAGATRGETPRLRILDRALRQQRAFQQINMMETHPWRPQRGLPERSVSILRAWLFEHFLHPYPSDVDKHILARQTGLSRSQVSNWFINARVRLWKPMVEEMYMEEEKEQQITNATSSEGGANNEEDITICTTNVQNPISPMRIEDQKPAQAARLLRIDSECVSSIINNTDHKNDPKSLNPLGSGRATDTFGSVDLDFSSYTHHTSSDMVNVPYTSNDHGANQSFHGGGGVSLTLGLQQHGGSGVSLAFPAATVQSPMFFTRDQIEECQTVQYSLLDSEGQNMPYRNLMGTQLLHDLA